jgi:hypothetical protein
MEEFVTDERLSLLNGGSHPFASISGGLVATVCAALALYQVLLCGLNMQVGWEK